MWFVRKLYSGRLISKKEYIIPMRLGHKILLRPTEQYLRAVMFGAQYHDETVFFLTRFLKKDAVIIDIGANIGLYTCAYAQYFKHLNLKIYSIEALKNNFELLKKNVELNHLSNVQIDHLALGKDNGTLTFKLPSDDYIGNAVGENIKKSSSDSKDVFILEQVEMLTLDAYAQKNNITRCDFIKIDIEGAEYFVFQGGKDFISRYRPIIQAEFNAYWIKQSNLTSTHFFEFFTKLDYVCAVERNNMFIILDNPFEYVIEEELIDLLFIPKEKQF